ncbi:polyprenyl synthetase family protein [Candidatus Micrarchaeota archaeon]|nr:polyprenyl synthetase family protein [Candidatus Micrarchaeota archaeon]
MTDVKSIEKILEEKRPLIDKIIEKYIPRRFSQDAFEFSCGKPRYKNLGSIYTYVFSKPVWELLDRGGKRWRPVLFLLLAEALGADTKKAQDFVMIPEIVHDGSLIIDDLEDSSLVRRGKPCLHHLFGIDVAVNAGNAMYYMPALVLLKNTAGLDEPRKIKAYEVFMQEMINIHFGQGADIFWHHGWQDEITEEEYLQMCAFKTGTLARMSAKLAAIIAGADDKTIEACGLFAESIGVAFQIQDDILNLVGDPGKFTKDIGEDITEGKRSMMVIHCLKNAPQHDASRLRYILSLKTHDRELIDEAVQILQRSKSVDYAKKRAREILLQAWTVAEPHLKEGAAKEKVRAFAEFLVEREF